MNSFLSHISYYDEQIILPINFKAETVLISHIRRRPYLYCSLPRNSNPAREISLMSVMCDLAAWWPGIAIFVYSMPVCGCTNSDLTWLKTVVSSFLEIQ